MIEQVVEELFPMTTFNGINFLFVPEQERDTAKKRCKKIALLCGNARRSSRNDKPSIRIVFLCQRKHGECGKVVGILLKKRLPMPLQKTEHFGREVLVFGEGCSPWIEDEQWKP